MPKKLLTVIKYIFLLSATAGLFWYAISKIEVAEGQTKWEKLVEVWHSANSFYLFGCAAVGVFSHYLRAARWKILLEPLGYKLNVRNGFISVLIGYFVNLAIPRGGEISRCYNVYKLDGIPIDKSIGTVVAERIVDLIFMVMFIGIAFCIELFRVDVVTLISGFTMENSGELEPSNTKFYLLIGFVCLIVIFFVFRYFYPTETKNIWGVIKEKLNGVKDGALSIFKLEKKGKFFAYSWGIWIAYCFMTYLVILAFEETAKVGILGSITIFTTGGIGMTIPAPGGTGSYHLLVSYVMETFYNIKNAMGFAVIFHGWQTFVIIVVGAISLIASQIISDNNEEEPAKNS